MFPFWELAIAPVLDAIGTRRLVEIGALRGETTVKMLERLGPGVELHVIDPVPEFDPGEHERAFPGRYLFHRDLSLRVLPDLPPVDAALIDGDHNWYTVYHELKALEQVARDHDAPLPVMILHDVLWPYGRRDLYYGPDGVPEEFRQPFDQRGMAPGRKTLVKNGGGLNPTMYNALEEGGPRNGVMTGLEDWIAEYDKPLRLLVLPIYFGLAIVAEEERIERQPGLAEVLARLESADGRLDLLHLSEEVRLKSLMFQHAVFYRRQQALDRAANRYLDLLKGALLDEHYLENELRIQYLASCIEKGATPGLNELRDPNRRRKTEAQKLLAARRAGRLRDESGDLLSYFPYATMGRVRLDHLQACLDTVREEKVQGDLVECGAGRGGGAIFLRGYLDAHDLNDHDVWVVDEFRASPPADERAELPSPSEAPGGGAGFPLVGADLNNVRDAFDRFDLLDERVRFLQGEPAETLPDAPIDKIALLRIGGDLGGATADVLDDLYDRLAIGGFVVVDDYVEPACQAAVDEFRRRRGVPELLERIDWAGASWRKLAEPVAPVAEPAPDPAAGGLLQRLRRPRADRQRLAEVPAAIGAPHPPPLPGSRKDLSIVVVFYNMRREAARTLHALSRSYQQGIGDLDYEVIVVENGSADDQKLGDEYVRGFGPEFRYVDLGDEARPSPVHALNHGVALAGGENLALMIDGAHVLTPGVVRFGMQGLTQYEPAIVATQQWYVGPGQQGEAMVDGYDEQFEDRLFDEIGWPTDGYRLFQIGNFIGERDWFDGVWESNCLFVPRKLLEQVGAFDESFVMPGGGYANLELYERLGSTPNVAVTTILGEGSFHQVHGGTTTNQPEIEHRRGRINSYAEHYEDIRGRDFRGPGKNLHFVGTIFSGAVRTRARRRAAPLLFEKGAAGDPDGLPTTAEPIPDELKTAYTETWWRNLSWRRSSWLGERVGRAPGDLQSYQEILSEVRPDWVITMRTGTGGPALFLAGICELLGHGQVLSIDDREHEGDPLPEHPRLRYLTADTRGEATTALVADIVGPDARAMVVLGSGGSRRRTVDEFETFARFVPVGSYVIVENTIVNGHPVWPSFGPGPGEGAKDIVTTNHDFVADLTRERYTLSLNPAGYLKRIR